MESMHVYQTIPHPGIQGNLESYYENQVCRVSRESKSWQGRPQGRRMSWGHEIAGVDSSWGSIIPSHVTAQVAFLELHLCICDMGIDPSSESVIRIKGHNSYKAVCVSSTIYKVLK